MKKTLLYLVRYPLYEEFHLKQKFDGQINAFNNLGYHTLFIGFDKENFYVIDGDKKTVIGKTHYSLPNYFHTFLYSDMYKMAKKVVEQYNVDILYYRTAPLFKSMLKLMKCIKEKGGNVICEIPTFPPNTEKSMSSIRKLYCMYSNRFENKISAVIDYYTVIGEDAGGEYKGKPAINIENGIDTEKVPIRKPVNESDTIHILALASMCYWHGYDRIIKSLAQYDGDKKVVIHMVGGNDGGYLEKWKDLANNLKLQDKVIFHGKMSGKPLEEMFDLCDIGVNSLAMYKKGFSVTMELKSREYMARGLPFICAVDDPALSNEKTNYWFRVPNDDSIPDMNKIIEFALKMKNDATHVLSLRNIAESKLTWEKQYKKVIDIMEVK